MEFNDRVRQLREERRLTHSQIAAMLGKSEGAVRSWEMARSSPDIATIAKLAAYFDCTTDFLLGLTDFKNIEDVHRNIASQEKLISFLDKMEPTEKDYLISSLNFALDFMLNTYLKDAGITPIGDMCDLITKLVDAYKETEDLCLHIEETGVDIAGSEYMPRKHGDLLIYYMLKLFASRDELKGVINKKFDNLLAYALSSVRTEDIRAVILTEVSRPDLFSEGE